MRSIKVLVADGGRARFLERAAGSGAYRTVLAFDSASLHAKTHDLGRDKPARAHESAGNLRHAIEPKSDLKARGKREFLSLVAGELAAMAARGELEEVVVVAPARCLSTLRAERTRDLAERVIAEVDADLTKTPDEAIADHLDAAVPALARYGAALRARRGA